MTVEAEHGEIAEVGSPVSVPVDPSIDRCAAMRWTTVVVASATLFLGLFNGAAVTAWLDGLTPTPTVERLRAPLDIWRAATGSAGLNGPRAYLHGQWEKARAARFGREHPGEPGSGG